MIPEKKNDKLDYNKMSDCKKTPSREMNKQATDLEKHL